MATSEFTQLIAALEDLLASSPRMPVTDLALVREQELIQLLARLRASVPASAVTAYERRGAVEAIRANAHADADDVLQRAQDEVERLVHDPHLQRDARQRADEALSEAQVKAESIRASADAYYTSTLATFAEHLSDIGIVMERDIQGLREGIESLRVRTAAARASGTVALEPERPLFTPGLVQEEYHEPPERGAATPEPREGPNTPASEADSPLA